MYGDSPPADLDKRDLSNRGGPVYPSYTPEGMHFSTFRGKLSAP